MTKPDLRELILAHLRLTNAPIASRDLASRFLLIRHDDESTCHRLLAPFLKDHPALEYAHGQGWSLRRSAPKDQSGGGPTGSQPAPQLRTHATPLQDFVALASDGAGPSGSGTIQVVSLQPVVAGEECGAEHLPSWAAEEGLSAGPGNAGRRPAVGLESAELRVLVETVGDLPIVCHRVAREAGPLLKACVAASIPFHPITISLAKLGHALLGLQARHSPAELASALGLQMNEPDDCRGRVQLITHCFLALLSMLEENGITTFDDLQVFQNQPSAPLDFSPYSFTPDDLRAIPVRPGVYRFYDRSGTTLYVGKAKNLRTRLSSYFVPSARHTDRGRVFQERVHSFSFEIVASELEALLNEAALLAELQPPLNRQFEVHERPAPYGPRLNLAVVLPEGDLAEEGAPAVACTVHLMHRGRYQGRICTLLPSGEGGPEARNRWRVLDDAVRGVYFQSREGDGSAPGADAGDEVIRSLDVAAGEVDWQLVASYLSRYKDEVNVLDVDECGSPEAALARLRVLATATVGRDRVVAR